MHIIMWNIFGMVGLFSLCFVLYFYSLLYSGNVNNVCVCGGLNPKLEEKEICNPDLGLKIKQKKLRQEKRCYILGWQ